MFSRSEVRALSSPLCVCLVTTARCRAGVCSRGRRLRKFRAGRNRSIFDPIRQLQTSLQLRTPDEEEEELSTSFPIHPMARRRSDCIVHCQLLMHPLPPHVAVLVLQIMEAISHYGSRLLLDRLRHLTTPRNFPAAHPLKRSIAEALYRAERTCVAYRLTSVPGHL